MKRRTFGLMASSSLLAFSGTQRRAFAEAPDPSLLSGTLTPLGAERAGNAAGTIPAWTGGLTAVPPGFNWDSTSEAPPDFFAADAMLYEVNASNMAQYAALLSDGVQALIQKRGFSLQVYPTRRTASAPQAVYEATASGVGKAQPETGGYRFGFSGVTGGIPFPIPDSDPLIAGAQVVWNHQLRWGGVYTTSTNAIYTVQDGQVTLATGSRSQIYYPFYDPSVTPENYKGYYNMIRAEVFAPSVSAGGELLAMTPNDSGRVGGEKAWQVLAGQGRVRQAPEVEYDTPSSYANGTANYDETYGFNGPMDRYDWRLLGKKEMLIPYNNNKLLHTDAAAAHLQNFIDPAVVRWELHRVWVVEATLHPGERNVLARRRLYLDEDTWMAGIVDSWDGNNNLQRHTNLVNQAYPNLPGVFYLNAFVYDVQSNNYVSYSGQWGNAPYNTPFSFAPIPMSQYNPTEMAASASY